MEKLDDKQIKHDGTTRNIRKPGDVGNLNFSTFTQNRNGLISWGFKIPASACCQPLAHILKRKLMRKITTFIILGYFIFNYSFGQNIEKAEANLDKQLVAILDTIYVNDQKYRGDTNYRKQVDDIAKKYGEESKEFKDHLKNNERSRFNKFNQNRKNT